MTTLTKQKLKPKPVHYPKGAGGFNWDLAKICFTKKEGEKK